MRGPIVDLTDAELARLRIRVDHLPVLGATPHRPALPASTEGMDTVGLRTYDHPYSDRTYIGFGGGAIGGYMMAPLDIGAPALRFPSNEVWVSTTDASTRDRIARWVAKRLDRAIGSTAPGWWCFTPSRGGWALGSPAPDTAHSCVVFPAFETVGVQDIGRQRWENIPALQDGSLDPCDSRLLPDGSRWVDAAALAEVARHLGSRP